MGLRLRPRFGGEEGDDLQVRAARPHVRAQVPECRVAGESLAAPGDGCEREWQPGARRLERRHFFVPNQTFLKYYIPLICSL